MPGKQKTTAWPRFLHGTMGLNAPRGAAFLADQLLRFDQECASADSSHSATNMFW